MPTNAARCIRSRLSFNCVTRILCHLCSFEATDSGKCQSQVRLKLRFVCGVEGGVSGLDSFGAVFVCEFKASFDTHQIVIQRVTFYNVRWRSDRKVIRFNNRPARIALRGRRRLFVVFSVVQTKPLPLSPTNTFYTRSAGEAKIKLVLLLTGTAASGWSPGSGHKALRAFGPAALGRDFDRFFISALHRFVVMSTYSGFNSTPM